MIRVFTQANIETVSGFIGNYETTILSKDDRKEKLKHGVVIVATGAQEYQPSEYLYGQDSRIITQRELEESLSRFQTTRTSGNQDIRASDHKTIKPLDHPTIQLNDYRTIVMIQCIGSRDNDHPYCSRICCAQAVKNALRFLEINPHVDIYILYKDVRTYGFKEDFYKKAREAGVVFIRYDDDFSPELHNNAGKLNFSVFEPILREKIEIEPDLVVLSTGIESGKDNETLAKMLKVPLNTDGFFLEAHVKLRPVDFATEGIFVAGLAHNPKCIDETISQAEAVAARTATIIANKKYYAEAAISHVNEELCAGCGVCSSLCPYEAIEIVTENGKRKSKVNEALCKGCGTCASACPSGAIDQYGFTKQQVLAMVESFSAP